MEYTREEFIRLLEKHFGKVLYNGRYYLEKHDNKEVAEILDYSDKQFGACLNPSDNTSYKTVVSRLLKHDNIIDLESQVELLKTENRTLIGEKNRSSIFSKWLLVAALAATITTAIIAIWLPINLKNTVSAAAQSNDSSYIVDDRMTVDRIMEWHGEIMMNTLAWEALLINEKVRNRDRTLSNEEKLEVVNDARNVVQRVIKKGRNRLTSIGFETKDGKNLGGILEQVAPFDSLFAGKENGVFGGALRDAAPYLLSQDSSLSTIAEKIREISLDMQIESWSDMKNVMKLPY